ncbi:MAG TPA: zinc ribbon domain-containing protein [Ktedonobacterales bacterium]|nr:zinc ribbon domain-containing protein [Ktedonobacterales bacterium]
MERCVFCQAALDAETRFCWQCGRARSSMLLSEATSPSQVLALPVHRCAVCGSIVSQEASVCGSCLSPQPLAGETLAEGETVPAAPTKRCAACGEESPIWARFCGACRQPFALPVDNPAEITLAGALPEALGEAVSRSQPRVTSRLTSDEPTEVHAPVALVGETIAWQSPAAAPSPATLTQPGPGQKPTRLRLKIMAALLATALVVTAGGATLAYFLTRPDPLIQVTSDTLVGNTPAGSPTTILHVIGQRFSHHSSVTLLLDGKPAPGAQSVPTDGFGGFQVNLKVTEAWRYGVHTLTATDARGYSTQSGARVDIVPRPVMNVQSQYHQGGIPAGSATTTLHISGKWFSYQSPITFLLDGQPVPGSQEVRSDAQGAVEADLTVTSDWQLGRHILTAKDAQGFVTRSGQPLAIVAQGEASTPGPNGAPADDASFTLAVTVQVQNPGPGEAGSVQETLVITGQADPAGGTVCQARDNGQPFTQTGDVLDPIGRPTGITYQETLTTTCSGSYKGGQLSYTETATSDQYVLSNGLTCQASTPYTLQALSGAFENATTGNGDWSAASPIITCGPGFSFPQRLAQQGAWSGAVQ